jgi:molybdopterin-binding protein
MRRKASEQSQRSPSSSDIRIGQAATLLGVSVDTLRRWEQDGQLRVKRSSGGQRLVSVADVRRLLGKRRPQQRRIARSSARNHFDAVVMAVTKGAAAATVEMQAGPFRLLALITAEAVEELGLEPGTRVVASVKATSVMVNRPEE